MKRMILLVAVFAASGIAACASNSWPTAENTFPASVYPTFPVYPQGEPSWPVTPAP